ncbi:replication factor C small subunit [Catovirus CTV1]|uniref:Replication factor C small subunit n=1 Tax=Catovirus CTV1 TaxID=1977631 RepID=A0A1V0SC64_9VIRU|nr:replication factor C small subunit [Catovirus CTV1]
MSKLHQIPWIEKYRPKKTEELILNETLLKKINKIISDKEMPNLIITGIPGIGKTTTIKCIVSRLYGKYVKDAVLELNASDDRGIRAVQDTITSFCKKKLELNNGEEKIYADHKIVILDEADNMTPKAQISISSLMEKYHNTTRFAFTCNSSADIIESIQSRCNIMRYMRLTNDQVLNRLKFICDKESVEYEENALTTIAMISQGDVRSAINNLQLVYNCYKEVLEEHIYTICDKPQPLIINSIFDACVEKNFRKAVGIFLDLKASGFMESDIILNMIYMIRNNKTKLNENLKNKFLEKICHSSYIISKGFDSPCQMTSCIASLISMS